MTRPKHPAVEYSWLLIIAACLAVCVMAHSTTNDVEHAMVADADGDGISDWLEWQSGTNPGDSNSYLRITDAKIAGGKIVLVWTSVSQTAYEIVSSPTLDGLNHSNAHRISYIETSVGTGPWHETISAATNDITGAAQFFRIERAGDQSFEEAVMDMAFFE